MLLKTFPLSIGCNDNLCDFNEIRTKNMQRTSVLFLHGKNMSGCHSRNQISILCKEVNPLFISTNCT